MKLSTIKKLLGLLVIMLVFTACATDDMADVMQAETELTIDGNVEVSAKYIYDGVCTLRGMNPLTGETYHPKRDHDCVDSQKVTPACAECGACCGEEHTITCGDVEVEDE